MLNCCAILLDCHLPFSIRGSSCCCITLEFESAESKWRTARWQSISTVALREWAKMDSNLLQNDHPIVTKKVNIQTNVLNKCSLLYFWISSPPFYCSTFCVCHQQPVKEVLPLPRHPSPLPVTSMSPAATPKRHAPGSIQNVQVASSGDPDFTHVCISNFVN